MPTKIELCNASDVDVGAVLKVEKDDLTLAIFNLDGEFFVTDDHCTHGPGSLSEGFVEGDVVECNFHGGQVNIRTGAVVGPPCMVPIKTYPTVVEDGKVFIEVGVMLCKWLQARRAAVAPLFLLRLSFSGGCFPVLEADG